MPLIEIEGVSHNYRGQAEPRVVLEDISLRLEEPRIGVIGANGSGKSTFVRMLNALVIPTAGTVRVDGLDTRRHGRKVRQKVGFCFTNPDSQIVMPTVSEDVAFGLRRSGVPKPDVAERVTEVLDRFDLAGHADHAAHSLSGGQKQLLALAAVLITEPEILVLDEPTTLLDRRNSAKISALVTGLPQQVILVTHQLHLLDSFDRVLVFAGARVVYDGSPSGAVDFYMDFTS